MPSLGPLTSYLIVHPAARLVSGPLQGQGALFSMESIPAWRALPGSGLVSGVSSAWVSVLHLGAWVPAILGPSCPF